jgi:hypothetical protein
VKLSHAGNGRLARKQEIFFHTKPVVLIAWQFKVMNFNSCWTDFM